MKHKLNKAFLSLLIFFISTSYAQNITAAISKDLLSVQQFFALPNFQQMRLSPDGSKIAAIAPYRGRKNLIIVDVKTRQAKAITSTDKWDVRGIQWIGDRRLYFTVVDGEAASGRPRLKGGYAIDPDGTNLREVWGYNSAGSPYGNFINNILATEGGDSAIAYVSMNLRSKNWADVYRIDFRSLRTELLSFNSPGRVSDWIINSNKKPVAALRTTSRASRGLAVEDQLVILRQDEKWETVLTKNSIDGKEEIGICGLDSDDKTLYISARRGFDKAAIWKYDINSREFSKPLIQDPIVDINCSSNNEDSNFSSSATLISDYTTKRIIGIHYDSGMPTTVFFYPDSSTEKLFTKLRDATDGEVRIRWNKDQSFALISSVSDINPITYYLYYPNKNQLEIIANSRPWINPNLMPKRKFIQYKSRDGLTIPAYLTLPRDSLGKKLPLIINIHGGPMVRGYTWIGWGRWPEASFFAMHGYAVLEPEPRGSTGWGSQHFIKHFKQWGLSMQDDITDGALHLISEGIVDRERICLHGASYGGYAALQGLIREPGLFKCGNSFVAVTDLSLLQNTAYSDTARDTEFDYLRNEFIYWVGDSSRDALQFELTSPARNADKIQAPVMLTMGSDDVRVPLVHGEAMRNSMLKAGKSIEWKVYAEEGHGFNLEKNVVDFYTRSLNFFNKHIGSKN